MKTLLMIAAIFLGAMSGLYAQGATGTIMGQVLDKDSATAMPFARVQLIYDGTMNGAIADEHGKYQINGLKPGVYTVKVTSVGRGEMQYGNVEVRPDAITFLDPVMKSDNVLDVIYVVATDPLIDKNIPKLKIQTEDIEHSLNIRDPKAMLSSMSSDVKMPEGTGEVIIRGSRPGDAVYYIDGVKADDISMLPGVAIGSMEAYTGGIPAQYGDTTGGVIILESKSYFDLYNAWLAGQ